MLNTSHYTLLEGNHFTSSFINGNFPTVSKALLKKIKLLLNWIFNPSRPPLHHSKSAFTFNVCRQHNHLLLQADNLSSWCIYFPLKSNLFITLARALTLMHDDNFWQTSVMGKGSTIKKIMQTWHKRTLSLKRTCQTVDPSSHCGDVVKSFAKQCFHGFNHCLILKLLNFIVIFGAKCRQELTAEKGEFIMLLTSASFIQAESNRHTQERMSTALRLKIFMMCSARAIWWISILVQVQETAIINTEIGTDNSNIIYNTSRTSCIGILSKIKSFSIYPKQQLKKKKIVDQTKLPTWTLDSVLSPMSDKNVKVSQEFMLAWLRSKCINRKSRMCFLYCQFFKNSVEPADRQRSVWVMLIIKTENLKMNLILFIFISLPLPAKMLREQNPNLHLSFSLVMPAPDHAQQALQPLISAGLFHTIPEALPKSIKLNSLHPKAHNFYH